MSKWIFNITKLAMLIWIILILCHCHHNLVLITPEAFALESGVREHLRVVQNFFNFQLCHIPNQIVMDKYLQQRQSLVCCVADEKAQSRRRRCNGVHKILQGLYRYLLNFKSVT